MQIAAERKSNIKLLLHLCCLWAQSFGKCCEDALYYTLIAIQNLIYHGHLHRSFDVRGKRGWGCLCNYEVGSLHRSWFVELDAWHPQWTQKEFWCPKTRPPPHCHCQHRSKPHWRLHLSFHLIPTNTTPDHLQPTSNYIVELHCKHMTILLISESGALIMVTLYCTMKL